MKKSVMYLIVMVMITTIISCSNETQFRGYIPENDFQKVEFVKTYEDTARNFVDYKINSTFNVVVGVDTIVCNYFADGGMNGGFLLRYKEINPVSFGKKVYVLGYKRDDGSNYISIASLEPF